MTNSRKTGYKISIARNLLAALAALFIVSLPLHASQAAEPIPGTACSTLGEVVYAGGPGEAGYFLSCNGSQYVSILGYATTGKSLLQVNTDSTICGATITGRLRYNNDILEMCTGACWLPWGQSACDISPDSFLFADLTGQIPSTLVQSNIVSITGIVGNVNVTMTGGSGSPQYRICDDAACAGGGDTAWGTAPGTITNGMYLQLQITTAPTYDTAYNVGMNVGSGGDTWTVTTRNDNVPDSFVNAFIDLTNRPISNPDNSNIVQITGITGSVPISISGGGGQYRICNDATCSAAPAFTTSAGTITNGQYVQLRMTSSASYDTIVSTTLTVGTGSDTWSITTQNDDIPAGFNFVDITGATLGGLTNHAGPPIAVQITGITGTVTTYITGGGGEYRLCDNASCSGTVYQNWTTSNGSIQNGWYVQLRITASASFATQVSTNFRVGPSVSDTWYVTSRAAYSCSSEPAFGTVAHNGTVTGYTATTSNSCAGISTTRTCYDGTLNNPSYNIAACNNNCNGSSYGVAWAGWIAHGAGITAYDPCNAQTRTCTNGTLSGAYTSQTQICSCPASGGCGITPNGNTCTSYSSASVACGASCTTVQRVSTCNNGSWNLAPYASGSCSPAGPTATTFSISPTSFTFNGGTQGPSISPSPGGATWSVTAGTPSASSGGGYSVTATANGCYTGTSGAVGWTINPAAQSVTLNSSPVSYATITEWGTASLNAASSCPSGIYEWSVSHGDISLSPGGNSSSQTATFQGGGGSQRTVYLRCGANSNYSASSWSSGTWNIHTPSTCGSAWFNNMSNIPVGSFSYSNVAQITGLETGAGNGAPGAGGATVQWNACNDAGMSSGCSGWSSSNGGVWPNAYLQIRVQPGSGGMNFNLGMAIGTCGSNVFNVTSVAADCNFDGQFVANGACTTAYAANYQWVYAGYHPGCNNVAYNNTHYPCWSNCGDPAYSAHACWMNQSYWDGNEVICDYDLYQCDNVGCATTTACCSNGSMNNPYPYFFSSCPSN